jgi:hypothetical protein
MSAWANSCQRSRVHEAVLAITVGSLLAVSKSEGFVYALVVFLWDVRCFCRAPLPDVWCATVRTDVKLITMSIEIMLWAGP